MSKPVLGLDFDDVIFSFNASVCEFHNVHYGTSITRDDIMEYGLEHTWKCSAEEMYEQIARFCEDPLHHTTPPIDGAIDAVLELHQTYDIYLVTARPRQFRDPTRKWITRHLPQLVERVFFTCETPGGASRPKSDVCKELGVSVFVDDALHHAEDLAPAVEKVFLFDAPWNQKSENLPANVARVYSWGEITSQLLEI
ncbi:MAG: hypothetical protein WD049_01630 [Candidatus Paceibacterota bacterium]